MIPQTLVLDSEGLSKVIGHDREVIAAVDEARLSGVSVTTSAVTLVEARNPKTPASRFNWALSRVRIIPVTEQIAREASGLLAAASLHGHRHALDALVAATALVAPGPVVIFSSDPDDLSMLVQGRAGVRKV